MWIVSFSSYAAKFVKEYIEASDPMFAVGEYWDSCNYTSHHLDKNQGMPLSSKNCYSIAKNLYS
jgi:hypothetical protein